MPAKPLTKEQLKESAKLKEVFKAWQDEMRRTGSKVSQDDVADRLGIGQSAFSQYLNGKIPLNPDFAAKISGLIGTKVSEFSPTIARQINSLTVAIPSYDPPVLLPPDTIEIPQFDVSGSMGNARPGDDDLLGGPRLGVVRCRVDRTLGQRDRGQGNVGQRQAEA